MLLRDMSRGYNLAAVVDNHLTSNARFGCFTRYDAGDSLLRCAGKGGAVKQKQRRRQRKEAERSAYNDRDYDLGTLELTQRTTKEAPQTSAIYQQQQ
jgi:hypothetical protein